MSARIHLAEQTIDQHDLADLIEWLKTNPWLTQGRLVKEFERTWSEWLGMPHSTYVNSGSSANLIMVYSAWLSGRMRTKKIIAPAVSWATTVMPAIQLGLEPILCEADRDTFGMDIPHLEKLCRTHNPGAVILVHVLGVPCKLEPILELQKKYGFLLMEDSCAATGSTYDGRKVGSFGDLSSFSYYYGHHLSTIEGGMVCARDQKLSDLLFMTRAHGWAKDVPPDTEADMFARSGNPEFNRTFTFYVPGFNVRSSDLNARLGLSQMKKADRVVQRRMDNHRLYQERIGRSPDFIVQRNERAQISSISFAALASSEDHRAKVAQALAAAGVETRPLGGGNMSRQPFFRERYGVTELPFADRIHTTSFHLPNHPDLTEKEIHFVCDTVLSVRP